MVSAYFWTEHAFKKGCNVSVIMYIVSALLGLVKSEKKITWKEMLGEKGIKM